VPGERLDTWKAIAAHLGRDVRTVLRWHKDRGLPVHRVPGGKGRSVFAYADELDAWMESEASQKAPPETPPLPRRTPAAAVIAALVLLLLGVGAYAIRAMGRGEPVRVVAAGRSLIALDAANREVWQVPLPAAANLTPRGVVFVDLDGDDTREILAPLTFVDPAATPASALYCLDARGRLRWSRTIADALRFGAGEFAPTWSSADVAVVRRASGLRIAYAVTHSVWWPSIVAMLDVDGQVTGRFIHAGWITRLETGADGSTLLAGGVSNARDASILAVLEGDAAFSGAWPETSPDYRCACPAAQVDRYFVFPRSEANRAAGQLPLRESIEVRTDGSLLVRVPQRTDLAADALYEFTPSLNLKRAAFADLYWDWHRQLEQRGTLDHSRDKCHAPQPLITTAAPSS
jgi:hypothetical protein